MQKIEDVQQLSFDFTDTLALLSPDQIYARASQKLLETLKEDRRIERKAIGIHAEELAKYFSMWANTKPDGGVVVVGIEDDGSVHAGGVSISMDAVNRLEGSAYTHCPEAQIESKRISAIREDGTEDFLLVFRAYYNPHKVIKTISGEAFVRIADQKIKLKPDEVYHLSTDRGQIDVEQELTDLMYPDDLDWDAVTQYVDAVSKSHELEKGKLASVTLPSECVSLNVPCFGN
jgi:ATP-dependent DNA helicase RecG